MPEENFNFVDKIGDSVPKKRKINFRFVGISAVVVLLIAVGGVAVFYNRSKIKDAFFGARYAQAYQLVSDSISQSANIVVTLPKGVGKDTGIENSVKFSPDIKGKWVATDKKDQLIFQPDKKLSLGKYYTVTLTSAKGDIGKDFLVAEDPKIISILPKAGSEANENSSITIVFNRPMVPLTTLDTLDALNIPVEITPQTEGKFKWIGTRTLQFIPKNKLIASANYTVKIKDDFQSLDGLKVKGQEHKFYTRLLRYDYAHTGETTYQQAIKLDFNQPVDLEKTKKEIVLSYVSGGFSMPLEFMAEYGTKKEYDKKTKKYIDVQDNSIILVYNAKDKFGRAKTWDFNDNYKLVVSKAYPEKGDIVLNEKQDISIYATDIIKQITATSDNSSFVNQDFFDPQGKLWVEFYEDVDTSKSEIVSSKLVSTGYGEKCKNQNSDSDYNSDVACEKEADKKKVYFIFDAKKVGLAENLELEFKKIVNTSGVKLNPQTFKKTIKSYPKLAIFKTVTDPKHTAYATSLTDLFICSNNPVKAQDKKYISAFIKTSATYEFEKWNESELVPSKDNQYYECTPGQFQTRLQYRLLPNYYYKFDLTVVDHFSTTTTVPVSLTTGKMPNSYLNFYHFQKLYSVTTPSSTKLTFAAENMDYVNLHICQLSAKDMLYYLTTPMSNYNPGSSFSGCLKTVDKKIALPQKYWLKNYFTVDLKDYVGSSPGHYAVTFSHPNYKEQNGSRNLYEHSYLTVTNLSVVGKKVNVENYTSATYGNLESKDLSKLNNLYWVTSISTLQPVAKAKVELYSSASENNNYNLSAKLTAFTDTTGIAKVIPTDKIRGVIVSFGPDSAIIADETNQFEWANTARSDRKLYVYTDRPIYKPGDTVNFKGLYRLGYDGTYEIIKDKDIPIKVYDSQDKEVSNKSLKLTDYGTFSDSFILDSKSSLGSYRIAVFDEYSVAWFTIEQYVPAPFKVSVKADKSEYVSGDTFKLDVDASYYFGAAVEGGTVEYSINSQDYHFDKYTDEYFSFGSPWYYCYSGCSYGDKYIMSNKLDLGADGKAQISQQFDINKLFSKSTDKTSKIFTVYITVKNKTGQSVTANTSFIMHVGEYYLGIKTDKSFLGKNETSTLKVKSVDKDGKVLAVKDVKLTISKIKWSYNQRQEVDGGYYYNWEKKIEKVSEEKIDTDKKGDWSKSFSLKEEGEYSVVVQGSDKNGNTISSNYELYVWGDGYVDVQPSNDNKLEVITDKSYVDVGDTASIVIKSPYKQAKALITIERGEVYDYKIVDINQSLYKYEFTVSEKYIPNVYVSVVLLSSKPEVRYGNTEFTVNSKEKKLSITTKADKSQYLPGEKVKIDFKVTDSKGQPKQTELSTAVVDMSVLALKGNPKKNPLLFFYSGFPLSITTISNVKNILYKVDVPVGTKGGGGAEADDLAKKKRGTFKDTAFWQAVINTDSSGQASVNFTLPDNLTTWQVETIGVSKDTKLGVAYQEFVSKKDVMVVPQKPRFVIPGDQFYVGAKVFNQTNDTQKLDVSVESKTLKLSGNSKDSIKLKAGETSIVYFNVSAPVNQTTGTHKFTLSAKNSSYNDTVDSDVNITRNDTYEAVATAGYGTQDKINEYVYFPDSIIKDKGELTINHGATLAIFMSEALNYLFDYPYGCSEQIASKLEAIAIIKKSTNLENIRGSFQLKQVEYEGQKYSVDKVVEMGLARLYQNQQSDGGFSYYKNYYTSSDLYLTLHVANTLKLLKDAGYKVDSSSLKNTVSYINNQVQNHTNIYNNKDLIILSAYTLSQISEYGGMNQAVINYIKTLEKDKKFINEQISNNSLNYLAILLSQNEKTFGKKFKDAVYNILENRVAIDARGAYLSTNSNLIWQYYETPVKNTALLLKSIAIDKRESVVTDRVLRWLVNSRDKTGAWGSTNNTITVIDAMVDYLKWKQENKSDFTLKTVINGKEISSFSYKDKSVTAQNTFVTPLSQLKFGELNSVTFNKTNNNKLTNNFYYDLSLKYYLPVDKIGARDEGFTIERGFYKLDDTDNEKAIAEAKVGDVLRGHLKIVVPRSRNFVSIEDYIPAGVELINFNLATESQTAIENDATKDNSDINNYDDDYNYWGILRPDITENRDDRLFLFSQSLSEGVYEYDYYVRVLIPGTFNHLPAVISEMYFPENFGRTKGEYFVVKK